MSDSLWLHESHQASLSITNSRSSLKIMGIKLVMPYSHLILCCLFLLLSPIPPSIRGFSNESTLLMRWPKYWSFSFSISPSKEYPGLISFRMDWLDLFAVQGTLKSLLQQRHYFANEGPPSQGYGFSSGHVWMWELDCEESWALKNWCFWTVVLEKTFESPLDCKEIQPVHSKRDQPWDFFGRTDAKAETPVLWPPDVKRWVIGKDSDTGRDWGLGAGGKGDYRGWDGWMASPTW